MCGIENENSNVFGIENKFILCRNVFLFIYYMYICDMKYLRVKLEDNKNVLVDESVEIKEGDYVLLEYPGCKEIKQLIRGVPYENAAFVKSEIKFDGCKHKKLVATINHTISLDVPGVIVDIDEKAEDGIYNMGHLSDYLNFVEDNYHYHDDNWYDRDTDEPIQRAKMLFTFVKTLKKEYIELETYIVSDDDKKEIITTERVDGQLMVYVK